MTPTVGADGAVGFPERSSAWLKEGTFVNVDNLRQVAPGLTKNQVYALLQEPHFSEGIFGVHVWNYIFNFRTGHGQDVVTCQYQIQFDNQYQVKATYWKDPACADLIAPAQQGTASTPDDQQTPRKFTLDFGVLFPFGKSSLQDLLPAGRTALDNISTSLTAQYRTVKSLRITGYTDRIGRMTTTTSCRWCVRRRSVTIWLSGAYQLSPSTLQAWARRILSRPTVHRVRVRQRFAVCHMTAGSPSWPLATSVECAVVPRVSGNRMFWFDVIAGHGR